MTPPAADAPEPVSPPDRPQTLRPTQGLAQGRRWLWWAWAAFVVVGLLLRLTNLGAPLTGEHAFRQTQTAWTAREFVRGGISFTHVPMPVLGPPWEVPFEMPLYQAAAAAITKTTGLSVDASLRLTSVLGFYAATAALFALAWVLFDSPVVAAWATVVFVWSPFAIFWSRAGLMEYPADAFALLYALGIVWALRRPKSAAWALPAATIAGCLGGLVKITTMAVIVPPVLLAVAFYWAGARQEGWGRALRRRWPLHAGVLATLVIPVVVAQLWINHADAVKAASPATAWLTSARLKAWNFGTLDQRLSPDNWLTIGARVGYVVLPYAVILLPLVALIRGPWRRRAWTAAALAGAGLPVAMFFNLFVQHTYYLNAIMPMLALAAGAGLAALPQRSIVVWIVVAAALGTSESLAWWQAKYAFTNKPVGTIAYLVAQVVQQVTPPDRMVVVQGMDWDPSMLYYADRHGVMWYDGARKPAELTAIVRQAGPDHFATLVFKEYRLPPEWGDLWKDARVVAKVGPFVIAVVRPTP